MAKVEILNGDCKEVLKTLPDNSINTCVTSPPYFGLRDYKTATWVGGDPNCDHIEHVNAHGGERADRDQTSQIFQYKGTCEKCGATSEDFQIGLEETPQEYVDKLVEVFREVKRVLRDDGTLWVNIGDSYSSFKDQSVRFQTLSGKSRDEPHSGKAANRNGKVLSGVGLKNKDLIGIPWRLAFALQQDGWYLRQDIIWCLSGGTSLYVKTPNMEGHMTVKDVVRLDPSTVKLWNGHKWTQVLGWGQSNDTGRKIEIVLRSGERIGCTSSHLWPTQRGNVKASELKIGDVIETCVLPEPENPRVPLYINDDILWFIGLYMAEGSKMDNQTKIQLSLNADEIGMVDRIKNAANSMGATCTYTVSGNSLHVRCYGRMLSELVNEYIGGETAHDKHFNGVTWLLPNDKLKFIMNGYLDGDAHLSENRYRLGFCRNYYLERDLRIMAARLDATLTLNPCKSTGFGRKFPSFRGEWRWNRSNHHNEKNRSEIVAIRNSRGRKFWDISVEDDPHLFSLSSGVLTHNCKPNPMPESVKDRCTKSHEYIFLLSKKPNYYFDNEAIKEPASSPNTGKSWEERKEEGEPTRHGLDGAAAVGAGGFKTGETRNKRSVWTVTTKPFKEAHFACVDSETEALTPNGWKKNHELTDGDIIAAYDKDADAIIWQPASFHRYEYDGEMIIVNKLNTQQLLTPNHRCLVKRRSEKVAVVRADELKPSHKILLSAPFTSEPNNGVGEEFAELLGWYVTEGYRKSTKAVEIYQSESANPHKVERIRNILKKLGASWTEYVNKRTYKGRPNHCVTFKIKGEIAKQILKLCPDRKKTVKWEWIRWPKKDLLAFVNAVIDGDGNRRKDGRATIIQKDEGFLDVLQVMLLTIGKICTVRARKNGNTFAAYITDGRWLTLRGTNGVHTQIPKVPYKGIVWCPKVDSTFWLARKNGSTFVTGNTFPPDLIEPCILAGCPEDGTVLDPFGGAGTTGLVAKNHGRNAILIELNPDYVKIAQNRIMPHNHLFDYS